MKVLLACEESQIVCKAFREKGHEAYSNDIQECSGGHPEWHLQMDIFEAIKLKQWDLMIAFPPCTYLTVTRNKYFKPEYDKRFPRQHKDRENAIKFFMDIINSNISKIAVENPIGIMSTHYRKPDQIIQPYMFGDSERKSTCLWLRNLPKLESTKLVDPIIYTYKNGKGTDCKWHVDSIGLIASERQRVRSKTFPGIAKAMAEQWG